MHAWHNDNVVNHVIHLIIICERLRDKIGENDEEEDMGINYPFMRR